MSWDAFAESVTEAQKLAQPEDFDFLHRIGESYATLRRYAPAFLDVLKLRAAPAAKDVLDAIEVLRGMNADNARKVPADAPTSFIKQRWEKLVMTDAGIDRRYYELCALSELKNALRSGDIWVQGSRQFKDFDEYLVPAAKFAALEAEQRTCRWPWTRTASSICDERLALLEQQLATVNRMAPANELPDAIITESGLKITPLDDSRARRRAGADRPGGEAVAAHQDHRTAAGGGWVDGLYPPLHAPQERRTGRRQNTCC